MGRPALERNQIIRELRLGDFEGVRRRRRSGGGRCSWRTTRSTGSCRSRSSGALLVHDWLMYISFFLLLGHLYLSLLHPTTRHSLSAITRGWVREDWARRHHTKWVDQANGPASPSD